MITLITGTPGAGKSLLSVWEFAKGVPGSFIEDKQNKVPRVLYSNVKDLLVEHVHISADDLNTWHEWAKPGAVILFDEVQEVWRPRSMGVKVPDCIAKLETHRHMGVDLVLVTQHPMLLDMNIRRLINQHLHLRRMTRATAMVYEWDRCANPQQTSDCLHSRVWFHPKKAYALYKSAQLHTKPTARIPKVAILGVAALLGLAYLAPMAYGRLTGSMGSVVAAKPKTEVTPLAALAVPSVAPSVGVPASFDAPVLPGLPDGSMVAVDKAPFAGCVRSAVKCKCYGSDGFGVDVAQDLCLAAVPEKVDVLAGGGGPDSIAPVQSTAESLADGDVLAFMARR